METHFSFVADSSMASQGTVPKAAQLQLAESGFKPRWSGIRLFILTYNKTVFLLMSNVHSLNKSTGFYFTFFFFFCLQIKKPKDPLMFTELLIIQNFFEDVTWTSFLICSNYVVFLLSTD